MITIEGKSVFGGVSIGKLMFYKRNEKVIRRTHVDDVDAEWKRFEEAKNTAIDQLKVLYDKAIVRHGDANAIAPFYRLTPPAPETEEPQKENEDE